jgi:hypothetical protein
VAHAAGHEAYHVAHHGWASLKDPQLFRKILEDMLILVTNNRDDFLALIDNAEIHPGLVVILENTRRDRQIALFSKVLNAITYRNDLINTVAEVDDRGRVSFYEIPPLE